MASSSVKKWWVHFIDPPESQELIDSEVVVGRGRDVNLLLHSRNVSRKHCQFILQPNKCILHCLGSTNGTFVNNVRLVPKEPIEIKDGDIVSFFSFEQGNSVDTKSLAFLVSNRPRRMVQSDLLLMKNAILTCEDPRNLSREPINDKDIIVVDLEDVPETTEPPPSVTDEENDSPFDMIDLCSPDSTSNVTYTEKKSDVCDSTVTLEPENTHVIRDSKCILDSLDEEFGKNCSVSLVRLNPNLVSQLNKKPEIKCELEKYKYPRLDIVRANGLDTTRIYRGRKDDVFAESSDDETVAGLLDSPEYDTYSQPDDIIVLDSDQEEFFERQSSVSIKKEAVDEVFICSDEDSLDALIGQPLDRPLLSEKEDNEDEPIPEDWRNRKTEEFFPSLSQDFSSGEEDIAEDTCPTKDLKPAAKRKGAEIIEALPIKMRRKGIAKVPSPVRKILPPINKAPTKKSNLRQEMAKKYDVPTGVKKNDAKPSSEAPPEERKVPDPNKRTKAVIKNSSRSRNDFLLEEMIVPVPKPSGRKIKLIEAKELQPAAKKKVVPPPVNGTSTGPVKPKKSVSFSNDVTKKDGGAPFIPRKPVESKQLVAPSAFIKPICHHYLVIYEICSWNPVWIKEQEKHKNPVPPPGITEHLRMIKAFDKYVCFNDYFNVFHPMFLNELWEKIRDDFRTNREPRMFQKHYLQPNDSSQIEIGTNKVLTCLAVTIDVKDTIIYFQRGDFAIMEVTFMYPRGQPKGQPIHCKMFSFIKSAFFTRQGVGASCKWRIEVLFKCRNHGPMDKSKPITLTSISYVGPEVKLFRSLTCMPNSCLSEAILSINPEMFLLETSTKVPDFIDELNETQARISYNLVNSLKSEPTRPQIALIHGPPGTGKTFFLLHLIIKLLYNAKSNSKPVRILLAAPSNAAVDHLVKLLAHKRNQLKSNTTQKPFKMVRIGQEAHIDPDIHDYFIDSLVNRNMRLAREQESDVSTMKVEKSNLEATLNCFQMKYAHLNAKNEEDKKLAVSRNITATRAQIDELEKRIANPNERLSKDELKKREISMRMSIIQKSNLVASTIKSCMTGQLSCFVRNCDPKWRYHFDVIVVDEAANCNELELQPLYQFGSPKLYMVGDHKQLAAVVLSKTCMNNGYGRSFFERAVKQLEKTPNRVPMLDVQYRMHPEIASWPSEYFYGNRIKSAPNLAAKRMSPLRPYTILDAKGNEVEHIRGNINNPVEVEIVIQLLNMIMKRCYKEKFTVGIITPYANQREEIRAKLGAYLKSVEVNTIDGFQGREKDIILMSCVRANGHSIGFLTSPQRLNVALTRARYSLIVICDATSLMDCSPLWKSMIQNAKKRNCFVTSDKMSDIFLA